MNSGQFMTDDICLLMCVITKLLTEVKLKVKVIAVREKL